MLSTPTHPNGDSRILRRRAEVLRAEFATTSRRSVARRAVPSLAVPARRRGRPIPGYVWLVMVAVVLSYSLGVI